MESLSSIPLLSDQYRKSIWLSEIDVDSLSLGRLIFLIHRLKCLTLCEARVFQRGSPSLFFLELGFKKILSYIAYSFFVVKEDLER